MTGQSKIEWTDQTWNPIVGCSIVSPGCTNCYAMRQAWRFKASYLGRKVAGAVAENVVRKVNGNAVWTGQLAVAPDYAFLAPLYRKKPTKYFVNSMGDLFHEDCPDEWIDRVFAVMALCPQHTFQVLTKRAARMRNYVPAARGRIIEHTRDGHPNIEVSTSRSYRSSTKLGGDWLWPLPNVWLGVSAERQQEADERIPELLATPAAVRFVSIEPMLDRISLHALNLHTPRPLNALSGVQCVPDDSPEGFHNEPIAKLDQVILGGESGPKARPLHPLWVRDMRDWCKATDVAFFFKQWGMFAPLQGALPVSKGGTLVAWPDGSIGEGCAELNGGPGQQLFRGTKDVTGRLLDGVEHNEFPRVPA